jgi:hypothetical protein
MHTVIPFIGKIIPDVSPTGNVIVIGSYSMRHVARVKGWVPGCFDVGQHTHEDYLNHWGPRLLNASGITCSLEESPRHLNDLFFARPAVDSKSFPAKVYTRAEFMEWREKIQNMVATAKPDERLDLTMNEQIVIAPVKDIAAEYRCWIIDRKVVTTSLYKRGDLVFYDGRVDQWILDYAKEVAELDWQPNRAYVLDVALCSEQPRVLEINTLNSAGFYAADMQKLVEAIEGMEF